MNKIRYSYLAVKMTILSSVGSVIFMALLFVVIFAFKGAISGVEDRSDFIVLFAVLSFIFVLFLVVKAGLPFVLRKEGLELWRNSTIVSDSSRTALAFVWAYIWRGMLVGGLVNGLIKVVLPNINSSIGWIVTLVNMYIVFYWMLRSQYGLTIIKGSGFSAEEADMFDGEKKEGVVAGWRDVSKSMINGVIFISYLIIGLIQIGAVYAFFRDVMNWWSIPSTLGSILIGYIPIIGSIAGVVGAIKAWGWTWYWSVILFFFPWFLFLIGGGVAAFNEWIWDRISKVKKS